MRSKPRSTASWRKTPTLGFFDQKSIKRSWTGHRCTVRGSQFKEESLCCFAYVVKPYRDVIADLYYYTYWVWLNMHCRTVKLVCTCIEYIPVIVLPCEVTSMWSDPLYVCKSMWIKIDHSLIWGVANLKSVQDCGFLGFFFYFIIKKENQVVSDVLQKIQKQNNSTTHSRTNVQESIDLSIYIIPILSCGLTNYWVSDWWKIKNVYIQWLFTWWMTCYLMQL